MDNERLAVCEFCGQTFYSEAKDEQARKREALMKCNCTEAVIRRKKDEYIRNAKNELREVFKYDFFSDKESTYGNTQEDIMEIISRILPYMVDFEVYGLTVSIPSLGKITLKVTSDGEIKIKRQIGATIEKKVSK